MRIGTVTSLEVLQAFWWGLFVCFLNKQNKAMFRVWASRNTSRRGLFYARGRKGRSIREASLHGMSREERASSTAETLSVMRWHHLPPKSS